MLYRIIVAHPGKQHSYRIASALKKAGLLQYYVTTIYDKEIPSPIIKIIKKFLNSDNLKRANSRRNPDLKDSDVVQFMEINGLAEAFVTRIDHGRKIYGWLQRRDADLFGIKVARLAIKDNADAVIMYDTNALSCFRYLSDHAPSIKKIMDVSSAGRPYRKKIYEDECQKSGHNDLLDENPYMRNAKVMNRLKDEMSFSDYFLVPSSFVRESLVFSGVKDSQILTVPYGANIFSDITREEILKSSPIHFLFIGNVNYNKGVPYILNAMSRISCDCADLTVTGAYNKNDWFVKDNINRKNINFTGLVTFDRIQMIYEKADVFLIPSFAEGMAQVGIEAMACGLPIICTINSGVSDLIEDGVNGFIIPAGDDDALIEKMQWFIDHRDRIRSMGNEARRTAYKYSWSYYEKNVVSAIISIMENKDHQIS